MVLLQNAFILQFNYLNMKTTSIILCMTLTAGLMIGSLSFDYQQQASAQMGMGKKNPNMMGMMNPNMMNKTGMMGMGMGNMMMNGMFESQNITSSVKLLPAMMNGISSQVKISLGEAVMNAQKELGNSSHAVAANIGEECGWL